MKILEIKMEYIYGIVLGAVSSLFKINIILFDTIHPVLWEWINTGVKAFIGGAVGFATALIMKKLADYFRK